MTRALWNVTYETITDESAQHGDAESRGYLGENLSFRDALDLFNSEREWHTVEADCDLRYPHVPGNQPRWFTDYAQDGSSFGEFRNVSLHVPAHITASSRLRVARLVMNL